MGKTIGFAAILIGFAWWALGAGAASPSARPTLQPSAQPTTQPSAQPATQPPTQPTTQPSTQPAKQLILDLGNKVSMKLVLIPAGKFTMGSPRTEKDRSNDETPRREVTISKPFYMSVYEVTQAQYQQVMGTNPSNVTDKTHPVDRVSWNDAVEFCGKLSRKTGKTVRLPTEAEWEYACRAGSTTRFYYGDDPDYSQLADYAWYSTDNDSRTHPVGLKKPNAWGLYDMHGNVWEWCSDRHASSYARAGTLDPQGPDSGQYRVLRGGGWSYGAFSCRSAYRLRGSQAVPYDLNGIRAAVSVPAGQAGSE